MMSLRISCALAALALGACAPEYQPDVPTGGPEAATTEKAASKAETGNASAPTAKEIPVEPTAKTAAPATTQTAIFAGGCFWCTESDFEKVPGVTGAVSGYIGGTTQRPTYEQVSAGGTGHYEAVRISYDPARVSYKQLAEYYFRTVDPLDAGGQFCDRGESYRTAIFVADDAQKKAAEAAKAGAQAKLGKPVATPILAATTFTDAEGYHQDYYKTNSLKYKYYRGSCGRDARLRDLWGAG